MSGCHIHAVNDAELPVIAPVDAGGEWREGHAEKGVHVNAGLAHLLEEFRFYFDASDVVIDYAHPHTLLHFLLECVDDAVAQSVVLNDVILQMDIPGGGADIVEKGVEFGFAVVEYADIVTGGVGRIAERQSQLHLLPQFG